MSSILNDVIIRETGSQRAIITSNIDVLFNKLEGEIKHRDTNADKYLKSGLNDLLALPLTAKDRMTPVPYTFKGLPVYHVSDGYRKSAESYTLFFVIDLKRSPLRPMIIMVGSHKDGSTYNIFWHDLELERCNPVKTITYNEPQLVTLL